MKHAMAIGLAVATGVAGGVAAGLYAAHRAWNAATARSIARLYPAGQPASAPPFSAAELDALPAPAARYLSFALTQGQAVVRHARVRQTGTFALRAGAWSPFTAVEHFAVDPPGFLWDARIRVAALLPFYVRDSYLDGSGDMYGTVAAIVPVVAQRGTPEMAAGELLRYLAEAVLFPTALLPRGGISWSALPGNAARVTLADGSTTVACDMEFGERGEVVRISALRSRAAGDTSLTPWVGRYSDYQRSAGMMVPTWAEVAWQLPGGEFPYWRGRMERLDYDFAS